MSKFNKSVTTKNKTINLAGGEAFTMTPELELVSALLTSFLEDRFYESGAKRQTRIEELVAKVDPQFAAKASIFARTEFGMRSVSHVVAGWIAMNVRGEEWLKEYFDSIAYRPDDMLEILSYVKENGGKQSHAMRKGFAKALTRFDAYQLAKYRASGKSVKLVDVVNLMHPQHTEQLGKLVRDELRNTDTFEAKISQAGQSGDSSSKAEAWGELVKSGKIGYMALVRNLRNIIEETDDEVVDAAIKLLTTESRIKKSLLLPFRFLTAYDELQNNSRSSKVLSGLSDALDISFSNVPRFDGKTLVVIDHSGSMGSGTKSAFGKAAMFGLALARSSGADLMHFGDDAEYLSFNKNDSTLTLMKWLDSLNQSWTGGKGYVGHGTNINAVFKEADKAYDRIVIISDMQTWTEYYHPGADLERYKKKYDANPFIYSWDINGYGQLAFPESRVATLAGWSEKTFDIMKMVETDKKALIKKINDIEL